MELRDFAPQVFELHAAGDYEAARTLVLTAQPQVRAEDAETVAFWRICLDARTGRHIKALDHLEAAWNRGWWYGAEMLADADLDPIRDDPRFVAVAHRSEEAQTAASQVPCSPIVVDPEGDARGTLVALHAAAGRSTHTSRIWGPAVGLGYRTIAVTSSQKVTSDRATWGDLDRAVADVTSQIGEATRPLLLGGRSMGAAVALHMATTGMVVASGLIMVAPSVRWGLASPPGALPTVILAGANDSERLRIGAQEAAEFLQQEGSPVDHQLVPDMGHFYPDNFESLLTDALGWIEAQTAG